MIYLGHKQLEFLAQSLCIILAKTLVSDVEVSTLNGLLFACQDKNVRELSIS